MTGGVDRTHLFEAKIPFRVGIEKGPNESAAGTIDVQRDVRALALLQVDQEIVDPDNVVGVAGERGSHNRRDADRVLVDVRLDVLRAHRVLPRLQWHDPRLHVEVAAELLPHDVNVAAEHQVRAVGGLPSALRRSRHFHLSERAPSMIASEEPCVLVPVVSPGA